MRFISHAQGRDFRVANIRTNDIYDLNRISHWNCNYFYDNIKVSQVCKLVY